MFRFCRNSVVGRPNKFTVGSKHRFQSEVKENQKSEPLEVRRHRGPPMRNLDFPLRSLMFDPLKMFSDMDSVRRTLFKDMDHYFGPGTGFADLEKFVSPKADIYENEKKDGYIVEVELPGVPKGEVKIELENDLLTISADRKTEKVEEDKEKSYYRKEISSGSFKRQFALPEHIDSAGVKATMDHGVLKITLPKSEKNSGVKINVD